VTRVQDAPNEETLLREQGEIIKELQKANETLIERTASLDQRLEAMTKHATLMEGFLRVSVFKYRMQVGTHNQVTVTYYEDEDEGMDAMRSHSGFRTLEQRKDADTWKLVLREWG
jgi:heme-degrading monooxygenase HmoA